VVDAGGLDGAGSSDSGTTNSPDAPVVDTGAETQQDAASAGLPPFKLAVLGKPGKWGANPNGDPDTAFQDWLNSSSVGATRVDNFTARATLTSDFLNNYNVIILASLSDDSNVGPWWTYSDAEVAAFQAWVQNGGGVIALTGYSSGDEMAASPTTATACGARVVISRSAAAPVPKRFPIGSARIPSLRT
jgi:hypothetical protein